MRRWLKIFGMVFAGVLTAIGVADQFGMSFIPPFDSGFEALLSPDGQWVRATIDKGDADCWLRLVLRTSGDAPPSLKARLGSYHTLHPAAERQAHGLWSVVISSAGAGQDPQVFRWPTGQQLTIESAGGSLVELQSWELHDASDGTDSSSRAAWRMIAQRTWWALFVLSIVAASVGFLRPEQPGPWRVQVLRLVIGAIEGPDKRQTRLMHDLLEKIAINGAPLEEAIASLRLTGRDRRVVPQLAFAGFRSRLILLQQIIDRFCSASR